MNTINLFFIKLTLIVERNSLPTLMYWYLHAISSDDSLMMQGHNLWSRLGARKDRAVSVDVAETVDQTRNK